MCCAATISSFWVDRGENEARVLLERENYLLYRRELIKLEVIIIKQSNQCANNLSTDTLHKFVALRSIWNDLVLATVRSSKTEFKQVCVALNIHLSNICVHSLIYCTVHMLLYTVLFPHSTKAQKAEFIEGGKNKSQAFLRCSPRRILDEIFVRCTNECRQIIFKT